MIRIRRLAISIFVAVGLMASAQAFAQSKSAFAPEALSAKALLEDLLARRLAQSLATKIDKQAFSISSQLDLLAIPPAAMPKPDAQPKEQEPLNDLMLGMLDPESLVKSFVAPEERKTAQQFLANYKIRSVEVFVGLSEALGPEVKTDVEKWLKSRISAEFGKNGKGSVSFIKLPAEKAKPPVNPKTPLDMLSEFQSLAGQIVLAAAIILGIILWQILAPKKSTEVSGGMDSRSAATQVAAAPPVTGPSDAELAKVRLAREAEEQEEIRRDITGLTIQLGEILPRVAKETESIVRSWCQMGEPGWLKLASFAEVVGKQVGKLPIPVDSLNEVSKVFSKMPQIALGEKRDSLRAAYWDLLTVMNLGAAALDRPFAYLSGANVGMMNQVLMNQNPKMRTVVSLFMPDELRSQFMKSLSIDSKRELLESAASLSEIPTQELRALDGSLMGQMKGEARADVVPLEMTLAKIVSALSPIEEVTLLAGMVGSAVSDFKRSTPSLAFLGEWPDQKLSILLSSTLPDELVAFCRVRTDIGERLISLAPQMTAELTIDELRSPDRMTVEEKNQRLLEMNARLLGLFTRKELRLDEIFPADGAGATLSAVNGAQKSAA